MDKQLVVLVTGGRDYSASATVARKLGKVHQREGIALLIHGGCSGADILARDWARRVGVQDAEVPANWDFHGKKAGPIRNAKILLLKPDLLVAFPGGRGTADMVSKAKKAGIRIKTVK